MVSPERQLQYAAETQTLFHYLLDRRILSYAYVEEEIIKILKKCGSKSLLIQNSIKNCISRIVKKIEKLDNETCAIISEEFYQDIKKKSDLNYYGYQNDPEDYKEHQVSVIDIIPISQIWSLFRFNDYINYYFEKFKIIFLVDNEPNNIPEIFSKYFTKSIWTFSQIVCPKCYKMLYNHIYITSLLNYKEKYKIYNSSQNEYNLDFEHCKSLLLKCIGCSNEFIIILNNDKIGIMNKLQLKNFLVQNDFTPETLMINPDWSKDYLNKIKDGKQRYELHKTLGGFILTPLIDEFCEDILLYSYATWVAEKEYTELKFPNNIWNIDDWEI